MDTTEVNKFIYVIDNILPNRETLRYKDYLYYNEIITHYDSIYTCMLYFDTQQYLSIFIPDLFPIMTWHSLDNKRNITCINSNIVHDYKIHTVVYDYVEIFKFQHCNYAHFLRYLVLLVTNCEFNIGGIYLTNKNKNNIKISNIIVGNYTEYDYIFIHSSRINDQMSTVYYTPFYSDMFPFSSCKSIQDIYYKLFQDNYNENIREYMHVNLL